jgi:hypothetical protein
MGELIEEGHGSLIERPLLVPASQVGRRATHGSVCVETIQEKVETSEDLGYPTFEERHPHIVRGE